MSQSVVKALKILEIFTDNKGRLTLSKISELSGYNITTVNRIISILVEMGYLDKSKTNKQYSLGNKFLAFTRAAIISNNLKLISLPHIVKLSRRVPETISVTSWDGTKGVHVAVIPSKLILKVYPEEGSVFQQPLHSTSIGKIILANMTDKYVEDYFENADMTQYSVNTITNLDDLKKHLLIVKREGVAFNDEEHHAGVRSVASAIKNAEGYLIGTVSVIGPSVRLTREEIREITPLIKECALNISREFGFTGEQT